MPRWRKICSKVLRAFLPPRWLRTLRDPMVLPGSYRSLASETEFLLDYMASPRAHDPEYWAAMLRKHTHILDKGMQRPDFEPGHGKQWFASAAEAAAKLEGKKGSDPSVLWALRKIEEYKLRTTRRAVPNKIEVNWPAPGDYEVLLRIVRGRRSARALADKPIELDKLRLIVEAVNWSPTSCNRQPAKVFVSAAPELVKQCLDTCAGATGFCGAGACFFSFCADLRAYNLPEEILLPSLDLGLGIQNCLLVAHTLGISITLLSWAQHTESDDNCLRRLLGIPPHCRIVVNAAAGYPALPTEAPARKPVDSTIAYVSSSGDNQPGP